MGGDVKIPAKVDGEVEAYLMLLWFVFVRVVVWMSEENKNKVEEGD
jgi:hypothetical protein